MITNEYFEALKKMQDILARKNELELEILAAPDALTNRKALLEDLKARYIEKDKESEELKTQIALLKADLFATESKKESSEKAMDNIKTQREYETLEKEIDEANKKASEIRKELQSLEIKFNDLDAKIIQNHEEIEQTEAWIATKSEEMDSDIKKKKEELDRLLKEREEVCPDMPESEIFKFERIIKNKKGQGIVSIKEGACEGCHIVLPPQFINEVRAGTEIKYCPYCSRILFYEASSSFQEDDPIIFDDSDMGGLADLV
ncbi:MAG: zinc ribbon domain-containing protein [Treponema sp.]